MSPWAPDTEASNLSESTESPGQPAAPQANSLKPPAIPWWVRTVPFFVSAVLFLSGIFAVFSPLPLLLLSLRTGRKWAWMAALTNAALVLLAGGPLSLSFYLIFILALALSLPEFLKNKRSVEMTAAMTLLTMALSAALVIAVHSQVHHVNPITEAKVQIDGLVDVLTKSLTPETRTSWIGDAEPEEWKKSFLAELPSAVAIFSLILVWANMLMVLRLNPGHLRERLGLDPFYFKRWKAPEFLLWPTILAGALLVAPAEWVGGWAEVGLNVFKFLMAVFAIQGLSILSFVFDVWNIKGIFRSMAFMVAVLLMMPLLLSLGFFDHWFDFRAKLRQS